MSSEVVGAITLKKGSAAVFFEPTEGSFTLVEKMPAVEESNVLDCVPREQWGRTVMLIVHDTNTGDYIASVHATLEGNRCNTHGNHRTSESPLSRKRRVRGPDRWGSEAPQRRDAADNKTEEKVAALNTIFASKKRKK